MASPIVWCLSLIRSLFLAKNAVEPCRILMPLNLRTLHNKHVTIFLWKKIYKPATRNKVFCFIYKTEHSIRGKRNMSLRNIYEHSLFYFIIQVWLELKTESWRKGRLGKWFSSSVVFWQLPVLTIMAFDQRFLQYHEKLKWISIMLANLQTWIILQGTQPPRPGTTPTIYSSQGVYGAGVGNHLWHGMTQFSCCALYFQKPGHIYWVYLSLKLLIRQINPCLLHFAIWAPDTKLGPAELNH